MSPGPIRPHCQCAGTTRLRSTSVSRIFTAPLNSLIVLDENPVSQSMYSLLWRRRVASRNFVTGCLMGDVTGSSLDGEMVRRPTDLVD